MTAFRPAQHGFKFTNKFQTEPIQNVRFGGLCGGMSYAALDYFRSGVPIVRQSFLPATGSPLFNYIYDRQVRSLVDNLDKWSELFFNPFGWRTQEFFNWGLQGTRGGRLQELRNSIDRGVPCPLGLFKAGNGGAGPHHQVLAIGYDLGRYAGDLGEFQEDLQIFVYDPNHHEVVTTVRPVPAGQHYVNDHGESWMTYFVDRKYRMVTPPVGEAGTSGGSGVRELRLEFTTGGDDLRGGNDNVNVTINFRSVPPQTNLNVNGRARWIDNYTQTVPVTLNRPVPHSDIVSVVLQTTFGGGIGGDNWNLDRLRILTADREIFQASGRPLWRFTGENRTFVAAIS